MREENWPAPVLKTSCITHSVNQLSPFLTVLSASVIEAGSSCLNNYSLHYHFFLLTTLFSLGRREHLSEEDVVKNKVCCVPF